MRQNPAKTIVRGIVLTLLLICAAAPRRAQAQAIVAEPNLNVFTVMAAMNVAGYDAGTDRLDLTPVRAALREELKDIDIPSREPLEEFYRTHRLADPGRDISRYISLALLMGSPPEFELQLSPLNLPPDVLELADLPPLIAAFYEQAEIQRLWEKYLPAMEAESVAYQRLLARVIQQTNGYLAIETAGFLGRVFSIFVNSLDAPNRVEARSYGDNYYIVASPFSNLPEEDVQHGWLHYMLDPYAYRNPQKVFSKRDLMKIVEVEPELEGMFGGDFSLLLTESLVRAVQIRRSGRTEQEKAAEVRAAVEEGSILTFYFYDKLQEFEEQPVSMRFYYAEMVEAINVSDERSRLEGMSFRAAQTRERAEARWSPFEQMIRQAEASMASRDYEEARGTFEALASQYGPQARVLYGLALTASQQQQPEQARNYFQQAAALSSDPRMKAWSHIYLGRMFDLEGEREQARQEYISALAAGDVSPDTRAAAQKGLDEPFQPPEGVRRARQQPAPEPEQEADAPLREGVPLGGETGRGN